MPNQSQQNSQKSFSIKAAIRIVLALLFVSLIALLIWLFKSKESADNTDINIDNTKQVQAVNQSQNESDDVVTDEIIEDLDYTPDALTIGVENMPRSLQGTQVDGDLIVNEDFELVETRELRRMFDYFLSAQGEEDSNTINRRVESYISSRTPEPAASQAIDLYYQYLAYLQQLSTIDDKYGNQPKQASEINVQRIKQQQREVQALRSKLFSKQANQAFFDEDDALVDYNAAMLSIAQDKSLTQAQKQQARDKYINQLPDSAIKQHAKQQANIEQLLTRTEELQQQGASQDQLFAMRSQMVGKEAAQRLAQLDAETADFDQRFEQYQTAKNKIITTTKDEQSQQRQIDQLQNKLFSKAEQKRLTGYALVKQQQQQ